MSLRIRIILPILLILVGVFLRFYKFEEFVTFLGDQGRDAIVIKRIVTFEHFPAIGAPSSLGQIYLGPFYYYLIAPFLLLFKFNPVGLAFGAAFFSLLGIVITYLIVKRETNFLVALIFLVFLTFSSVNVQSSRFSWNPNLLPFFSFFTLYFFYKTLTVKNKIFPILFGSFLSFSIQLHHLAFLLFIPILLIYLFYFLRHSGKRVKRAHPESLFRFWSHFVPQNDIKNLAISFLSFLFFSLPLIIFDLRHNFLNTKNLLKFFSEGNPIGQEQFFSQFLDTNKALYTHVFQTNLNQYITLAVTIFIFFFCLKKFTPKKNSFLFINFVSCFLYLVTFAFFNTSHIAHYYNPIYLSFYLILSWIIVNISKNKMVKLIMILLIAVTYIFLNLKSLTYLFYLQGNNQIKKAEKIADSILENNPQIPYQTLALPYVETDGHIRYFLEIKRERPLPADTLEQPKELYVLCFETDCQVLGNPQWQIASFKNAKIDKIWTTEGVKIYKLIHS